MRLADRRLTLQQVETRGLQRRQGLERRDVAAHGYRGCAEAVALAAFDRGDGAPGIPELREDRAAQRARMAQPRIVGLALERRRGLGIVQQEIAAGLLDALEAAAAQPARAADALLHMLAAVPMVEGLVVRRVDV